MRVLFIAPRYVESAGDGVYVHRLAAALPRKGVQVDVFTVKDGKFTLIKSPGILKDQTLDEEFSMYESGRIDHGILSKNFYSWTARSRLKSVLQIVRPDCIHIHGIHQLFTLSCMFELKKYGAPIVFTVHDYKILCGNASFFSDKTLTPCTKCLTGAILHPIFKSCKKNSRIDSLGAAIQMAGWKYLRALDVVDKFLVGSKFVFDLLSANQGLATRLRLCRFPYPQFEGFVGSDTKEKVTLCFVGRLVSHKGILIFARAVSDFQVPVHIFGDGNLIESTRHILQNDHNVTFHGWTSQREMAKYLSPGSIVIVPSLAYETFCYVVVEAMMRGCCVVASSRGGIPELIQDGQNGIIVDPPTPEGFRDAVKMLLADREKIITLGRRAMRITADLPNIGRHADEIVDIYHTLSVRGPLT